MDYDQNVSDMANEVLGRQAKVRAERTGEPLEEARAAVLKTEAGQQLRNLREGPYRDERAGEWQEGMAQERAEERSRRAQQEERSRRAQQEERSRARQEECSRAQLAAWKSFMQAELRGLEQRKDGQLARLLGEALPGEPPATLQRLASEDRRQAEEGLVALMRNGKVFYKHVERLSEEDMPARIAANRLRTTWLKERQDGWLDHGDG
jgi:hypothetical protein